MSKNKYLEFRPQREALRDGYAVLSELAQDGRWHTKGELIVAARMKVPDYHLITISEYRRDISTRYKHKTGKPKFKKQEMSLDQKLLSGARHLVNWWRHAKAKGQHWSIVKSKNWKVMYKGAV